MVRGRSAGLLKPLRCGLFCRFVALAVFLSTNLGLCESEGVSPERCLVWGSGLDPGRVLPVRYFYIQAVNSKGENLTLSPGKWSHTHTRITRRRCFFFFLCC